MDIFQARENAKYADAAEDAKYDEDMTGKQMQKIIAQKKQEEKEGLKAQGKQMVTDEIPSGIQQKLPSYLKSDFTLCLVGKPKSGKSTLMQKFLQDPMYYKDKFDDILLVSPSLSKMNLDLDETSQTSQFDFDWIFDHIYKINQRRLRFLQHNYMEGDMDKEYAKRNKKLQGSGTFVNSFNKSLAGTTQIPQASLMTSRSTLGINDYVQLLNRSYRDRNPQNLQNISTFIQMGAAQSRTMEAQTHLGFLRPKGAQIGLNMSKQDNEGRKQRNARQTKKIKLIQKYADEIHGLFKKHVGSSEEMKATHQNVILLLDDVIGEITKEQHSFQLAKLFLNRRHLVANATVSIIVSTQKYTMIPAKIRSNANWHILFSLSPNDFDLVRKDATSFHKNAWEGVLKHVFGDQVVQQKGEQIQEVSDAEIKEDHTNISIHVDGNMNRLFKNEQEFQIL